MRIYRLQPITHLNRKGHSKGHSMSKQAPELHERAAEHHEAAAHHAHLAHGHQTHATHHVSEGVSSISNTTARNSGFRRHSEEFSEDNL